MLLVMKNAWGKLHGSQTVKLLVLEFFVVLAGVLAAQVLQGWFADREERARARIMASGIGAALHNSAELALIRQRMSVCMRDRIELVRDALAAPAIDQSQLDWVRVPEQNILDDPGFDSARPLLTKVFGPEPMMHFNIVAFAFDNLYAAQDDELAAWQRLALLNPANGPVDERLRAELKLALAEAQRANRLMSEVAGIMRGQTEQLGTPVHDRTMKSFASSPKLCASMVGYTPAQHAGALKRGALPDGTPIHPRVLSQLAAGTS